MELWQRRWSAIDSHRALILALEEHLGYCTCAYDNAVPFLRDFLRLVEKRTNCATDSERFHQASVELEEFLRRSASSAVQSWFVYALDKADVITHGFNLYDILMMDRGWWLLDGLERFPEPPRLQDDDTEPGIAADNGGT